MEFPQKGPGMSIFQGSGQLHVDTDNQRELEEEAAADQQRRDVELEKLLTNALDDFYDDNESMSSIAASDHSNDDDADKLRDAVAYRAGVFESENQESRYILDGDPVPAFHTSAMETYMNSRNLADTVSHQLRDVAGGGDGKNVSSLHYQHCFRTSSGSGASSDCARGDPNELYRQTSFNSVEQLQVLYEVRVREVQRLTEQLEQLKSGFALEKDQLLRKLALSEAEKERAQLMHKQAHGLLVQQEDKTSELEKKVLALEASAESLEKTKAELLSELEASKTSVDTLHHKLLMLERVGVESNDKQLEMFLHNVQVMHNEQIKKLEDELAVAVAKLSRKELELERTKQESENRSLRLEARLAEQGDTLNQMACSLEESQRRCRQLMEAAAQTDLLHVRLAQAEQHRQALEAELITTKSELETLQAEMKHHVEGPRAELQIQDTNKKLQEELHAALIRQKEKREEVRCLSLQLEELQSEKQHQQAQIKSLEEERAGLLEKLEEEHSRKNKQKVTDGKMGTEAEIECKRLQGLLTDEASERQALQLALLKERQRSEVLEEEMADLQKKLEEDCSDRYLLFHEQSLSRAVNERDEKHKKEHKIVLAELEQSKKECDCVKELYVSACRAKEALQKALEEAQENAKTLSSELECEREKTKGLEAQNILFIEKLKHGKNKLEAAEQALAERAQLKAELEAQRTQLSAMEKRYEEDLKQLHSDRVLAVEEAERKAKAVCSGKISEEIERAKMEALLELKKTWKEGEEGMGAQSAAKLKQLEEEYEQLQQQYAAVVKRQEEDTHSLMQQLQQSRQELSLVLAHKGEPLQRLHSEVTTGPDTWIKSDSDKVYRDLTATYAEKLRVMKTEYGLKVQEISDRVRDETMQFCIQQMRQSETRYLAAIKMCKESYEKRILALQSALEKSNAELLLLQEKLKQSQAFIEIEKSQQNNTDASESQIKELQQKLEHSHLKALQTEKQLQTTIVKYSAAKRAVHKYRQYIDAQKQQMEKEWLRINSSFQLVLGKVQQKLSDLVETDEIIQLKSQMDKILKQ